MTVKVLLTVVLATLFASSQAEQRQYPLLALCYHDVVDSEADTLTDPTTITVDTLVQHLSWLRANGYKTITLEQWRRHETLPERSLLLTFDDGYRSFRTRVLPLLELFQFHAVLAPVTRWIDTPPNTAIRYGDELRPREDFLTWEDINDALSTGLVEIGSHSHDLHQGIVANPDGNLIPAAAAHRYVEDTGRYERDAEYRQRLARDLQRSTWLISEKLGVLPSAMVWPYGAYNAAADEVARVHGLNLSLTLDGQRQPNLPGSNQIHRFLVNYKTDLAQLQNIVEQPDRRSPVRAVQIELDDVYSDDETTLSANIDKLIERVNRLQLSAAFLSPFADTNGDDRADQAYFPNTQIPVRRDLFNRLAWQLKTRAQVSVFAWVPASRFDRRDIDYRSLYNDLGRHARFDGVLFKDDGSIEQTLAIAATLRKWQGALTTIRRVKTENIANHLPSYDYLAVSMEAQSPERLVTQLPKGAQQKVIALVATDRSSSGHRFEQLIRMGMLNIAYEPEHILDAHPDDVMIRASLSNNWYPAEKK